MRVASDFLGPGDAYCSVWHLFDLLRDGVGDWEAKFDYSSLGSHTVRRGGHERSAHRSI